MLHGPTNRVMVIRNSKKKEDGRKEERKEDNGRKNAEKRAGGEEARQRVQTLAFANVITGRPAARPLRLSD